MDQSPPADRIFQAIRAIARGQVAGYGEVARRAGLPGRARMVARLLSHNDDAKLPWHRVLRSDGRIAFAADSPEFAEQVARLRAEGVVVERGRVSGLRAAATLDEQLWGGGPGDPAGGPAGAPVKPATRAARARATTAPAAPRGARTRR